ANSSSSLVYSLSSNATVSASYHDVAGNLAPSAHISGPIHTNVPPSPDPLRSLAPPNPANYPVQTTALSGLAALLNLGTQTLHPGVYNGGINISGGSVTLAPGVYILNGGGF